MKIVKMKELAVSYKLKNAKKFKSTEQYLEYVIDEINNRANTYSFHQFLFLIDVLYVVLSDGAGTANPLIPAAARTATPEVEIKEHYTVKTPMSDAEVVKAYDRQVASQAQAATAALETDNGLHQYEDESDNLFDQKLNW